MQRHPENEQHHDDGADTVDDGALLDRGKFLIGDRDRAGESHARAVLAGEIEIRRRLPNGVAGALAGLQGLVV